MRSKNEPRSIGPRTAGRGKRKAGLLWEGEVSEDARLYDKSDCSIRADQSTYARWRIFVCQVTTFAGVWSRAKRRAGAPERGGSDPMREAGAPSTGGL
jgi:hypothetical protein